MKTTYKLISKIGEGGMGVVYLAIQEPLGKQVAMKFLPQSVAGPAQVARFQREVQAAIRIRHKNVIKILDCGQKGDQHYYVMEYLEGYRTILQVIEDEGRLDWARGSSIMEQVMDALDACHESCLIHRDVKPQNIMVSDQGHVVLMDFGLVKVTDADTLTAAGKIMGTPSYIAPEVFLARDITSAADQFSAGAVFYELITGSRAFEGATVADVAHAILRNQPVPLAQIDGDLAPYQSILDKLLSKYPEDRFRSAREAADVLRTSRTLAWREEISEAEAPGPRSPTRRVRKTELARVPELANIQMDPRSASSLAWPRPLTRKPIALLIVALLSIVGASTSLWTWSRNNTGSSTIVPQIPPASAFDQQVGSDWIRIVTEVHDLPSLLLLLSPVDGPLAGEGTRFYGFDQSPAEVRGLDPGREYQYRILDPGGGLVVGGLIRTRSVEEVGRVLQRFLSEPRISTLENRIRQDILAGGGRLPPAERSQRWDQYARWIESALTTSAVEKSIQEFTGLRNAFFGVNRVSIDAKLQLYLSIQNLSSLGALCRSRDIRYKSPVGRLSSEFWGPAASGTMEKREPVRAFALVWNADGFKSWDSIPRELVEVRFLGSEGLRVRVMAPEGSGDLFAQQFSDPERRVDRFAYAGRSPVESTQVAGSNSALIFAHVTGGSPANYLRVELGKDTQDQLVACLWPPTSAGNDPQWVHGLDPRIFGEYPDRLRLSFAYDSDTLDLKAQQVRLHWVVFAFYR